MQQYHELLEYILEHGKQIEDRTGVGTISIIGHLMRFDLEQGFPAITTKKLAWKSVVGELLWFLEGSTDERRLAELTYGKDRTELFDKNTIWTANADNQAVALGYANTNMVKELGPVYGAQWRNFNGVDQITNLIKNIKNDPYSRRHVITAWNVSDIHKMALPPCHHTFQFFVRDNKLSCMMNQRSSDVLLGICFNIASYSLLTHIIARECNLGVGEFIHVMGDTHIYLNHIDQVEEQLSRNEYPLPSLEISDDFNLMDRLENGFDIDDVNMFKLINYHHHPAIMAPMAV